MQIGFVPEGKADILFDRATNSKIKTNIEEQRFSLQTIACFKNMVKRFEVNDTWLACMNGKKIKVFYIDNPTKIYSKKFSKLNQFKLIDNTLVFLYQKNLVDRIGTLDLNAGKETQEALFAFSEEVHNTCIANKRVFGITKEETLVEWDFFGNGVRERSLKKTHDPHVNLRAGASRFIHSDQYVIYISTSGIHWFDLQKNELLEFLPNEKTQITATYISESFLFLAIRPTNLYDSYLLKLDLKTGEQNQVQLRFSSKLNFGISEVEFPSFNKIEKEMVIKNIIAQGDRLFLRIGNYIFDYERKVPLGSCKVCEKGEEPMTLFMEGQMLMYLTYYHSSQEKESIKHINVLNLTTYKIHSFVCPFEKKNKDPKSSFYNRSTPFSSTVFLKGRLVTCSLENVIQFDFLNPSDKVSPNSKQYKNWLLNKKRDNSYQFSSSDSETEGFFDYPQRSFRFGRHTIQEEVDESSESSSESSSDSETVCGSSRHTMLENYYSDREESQPDEELQSDSSDSESRFVKKGPVFED